MLMAWALKSIVAYITIIPISRPSAVIIQIKYESATYFQHKIISHLLSLYYIYNIFICLAEISHDAPNMPKFREIFCLLVFIPRHCAPQSSFDPDIIL